jgi:hypothetical protein
MSVAAIQRKTVLRSFRINKEVDDILQKEASLRGLSVNALVSQILLKFVEWDRFVERYGFITITRDGFQALHEALSREDLVNLARSIGERNPPDAALFWFKSLNLRTLLEWFSLHCKYGRIADYELDIIGRKHTIVLHHALGQKYSEFLGNMIEHSLRSVAKVEVKTEATKNSVIITFEA